MEQEHQANDGPAKGQSSEDEQFVDAVDYRLTQFYDAPLTSEDPDAESSIHSQLRRVSERYQWIRKIAVGGGKTVDQVSDLKTGSMVAMARPKDDLSEKLFEAFLREARLTATLIHPNIIRVYDVGLDEGQRPYFTMELKKGDSLSTILKKLAESDPEYELRYDRDTLLGMFVKICDGMAYAHSEKVLHLDLKPSNIQIGRFGGVQVCDWGLAKVIGSPADSGQEVDQGVEQNLRSLQPFDTLDGLIKGTPGYMAPEQMKQEVLTRQADIYSLGCILFSILTYQEPLSGSVEEVMAKTTEGKIRSPRDAAPGKNIPESLNAVVGKAMALIPENRYQSTEELQQEVKRYLAGYSTRAENAGFMKLLQLLFKRNRVLCLGLMVALVSYLVSTSYFIKELSESEAIAVSEKEISEQLRDEMGVELNEQIYEFARSGAFTTENIDTSLEDVVSKLDRIFEYDPDNKLAWSSRGYVFMMTQKFNEASRCFDRGDIGHEDEAIICKQWVGKKKDNELLTPDQWELFVAEARFDIGRKKRHLVERMMIYDSYRRGFNTSREHVHIVETVLKACNPRWKNAYFKFHRKSKTLILGGEELYTLAVMDEFSSEDSLLRTLRPKHLVLRGKVLLDLGGVVKLPLLSLDVSGADIKSFRYINRTEMLGELIVSKEQSSNKEFKTLRSDIILTVKD